MTAVASRSRARGSICQRAAFRALGVGSRDLKDQKAGTTHGAKEENPPRQLLVGFQLSVGKEQT